ncbi:MAG: hypothetical protein HGA45_14075 [Chloroflexales bacterium]|nr:hypothetical protein [Chloroflexales bacterium]
MTQEDAKELMEPFGALVGDWATESTHPAFGDTVVPGRVRFEWLAGERFLIERAENDHPELPDSLSVIGVMEGDEELSMQYFDSRGVHRIYQVSFDGRELRLWRDAPGFAQRITITLSDDGSTLTGTSELNENDQGFRDDLASTYRRSPWGA